MLLNTLIIIFKRDLNKLKKELELYKSENALWLLHKDISNCGGNLCLHLVGNLNAYIGAELGHTDYVRQRDLEFSLKDIPRTELFKMIDDTIEVVEHTLSKLSLDDLEKDFPIKIFKEKITIEFFLIHLSAHLAYHLGQISYHRRLLY